MRSLRSNIVAIAFAPLVLIALQLAAPALAADGSKLERKERSALKKAEGELLKLSRFAARGKDWPAAREALQLGLAICPDSSRLGSELERLEKKAARGGEPKGSFAAKLEKEQADAHADVALALAEAALAVEQAAPDRYERYVGLVQTRLPSQEALDKLDLVYFDTYFRWVSRDANERLGRGEEQVDGEWVSAERVTELNRQHGTWSDPWIVSDDVHEVRTTLPLRTAKQILAYVGAYREYFLTRFGTWDLKPPKGKLPLIVTETQSDLREQTARFTGGMQVNQMNGAAYYLQTAGTLNPCFVTYEPLDASGRVFKIDSFDQLVVALNHEVTHQIVFEYSKQDAAAFVAMPAEFWSIEAIANYMGQHAFDGKTWRLTHQRMIPMGPGFIEGPFAWTANNRARLTPLARFRGLNQQQFVTVENYHMAATLAYFLLEGEGGKYREMFIDLLEQVHQMRAHPGTFAASFPGVDEATLQQEWLRFVEGIELDA